MHPSRYAPPHEQDALTLPRPLRLVSNALIGLCLLALLALPVVLDSAARSPVLAAACSDCVQSAQPQTGQSQRAEQPSSP